MWNAKVCTTKMQQNVGTLFTCWPGSLVECPAPYCKTGAKSEGFGHLAEL